MAGDTPRIDDTLRMLARAGITATEADIARIEGFLARLRPAPPPALETDPWGLPRTEAWRHD